MEIDRSSAVFPGTTIVIEPEAPGGILRALEPDGLAPLVPSYAVLCRDLPKYNCLGVDIADHHGRNADAVKLSAVVLILAGAQENVAGGLAVLGRPPPRLRDAVAVRGVHRPCLAGLEPPLHARARARAVGGRQIPCAVWRPPRRGLAVVVEEADAGQVSGLIEIGEANARVSMYASLTWVFWEIKYRTAYTLCVIDTKVQLHGGDGVPCSGPLECVSHAKHETQGRHDEASVDVKACLVRK